MASKSTPKSDTQITTATPTDVLPGRMTKRDADDLRWFFLEAEGEVSPAPTFTIFDQQCLGTRCSLGGHVTPPEPSDRQVAAAGRARRIDALLSAIGHEHTRTLQCWTAPKRYFGKATLRVLDIFAGVALRTNCFETITRRRPGANVLRELEMLCETTERREAKEVVDLSRRTARAVVGAIRVEAAAALDAAIDAYAAARRAWELSHAPAPDAFGALMTQLGKGR